MYSKSGALDPDTTVQDDLRGGTAPWHGCSDIIKSPVTESFSCETLVVGAGITGAFVAERLAAEGRPVVVIDREKPGRGSTAASTAMLQWELDLRLGELADLYGFERAADIYRRSFAIARDLQDHVNALQVPCGLRPRRSLYIAGAETSAGDLLKEHALRLRAGLPGDFLDHRTLLGEFGFDRAAAILSPGSSDADPVLLAQGLLGRARAQGARIFDAEASAYHEGGKTAAVVLDGGHVIEARHVVLATGYVMPDFVTSDLHAIAASWAIATPPLRPERLWRGGVLIWEAATNYLYARTTLDGRIIIGGEDEAVVEPSLRDDMTGPKAGALQEKLATLWPAAEGARIALAWSGAFGRTLDALPLIGAVPGHPRVLAAYGYGGNGITFSYLAAQMIARLVAGERETWFDDFAIGRPAPRA